MAEAGQLVGSWRLVRPLGHGATAGVWLAHRDDDPADRVAVKLIRPHSFENARQRFEREAKVLRTLHHHAIVGFRDSGDDDGDRLFFLVMDLVEGEELGAWIRRGPMAPDVARRLFSSLADGLEHAHRQGIFHRDLKPENVMVRRDGTGCLIDFGIAVEEGGANLTREGMLPGTVGYFPPEVFERATRPDPRLGDVYALGVMLWEAVEGQFAFPADGMLPTQQQVLRILAQKLERPVLPPGEHATPDLAEVIAAATHPDPAVRTPAAGDLAARLGARPRTAPRASAAGATLWQNDDDDDLPFVSKPATSAPPEPAPAPVPAPPPTRPATNPTLRAVSGTQPSLRGARTAPGTSPGMPLPPPDPEASRVASVLRSQKTNPVMEVPADDAPSTGRRLLPFVLAGAALFMVVAGAGAVVVLQQMSDAASLSPVTVRPSGLVQRVLFDGADVAFAAGAYSLAEVPPGPHSVTLAAGSCAPTGELVCGGCCVCSEHEVVVAPGVAGSFELAAPEPPTRRRVQVKLDGVDEGMTAQVRIGSRTAVEVDGVHVGEVPFGSAVEIAAESGVCNPPGALCRLASTLVSVTCAVEPLDVALELQPYIPPVVEEPPPPPVEAEPTPERPTPTPRPRSSKPPPTPVAQTVTVTTRVEVLSGTIDEGVVRAGLRAASSKYQACWERLPQPWPASGTILVDAKLKRDGTLEPGAGYAARSGLPSADSCVLAAVQATRFGDKTGTGRVKIGVSFAAH